MGLLWRAMLFFENSIRMVNAFFEIKQKDNSMKNYTTFFTIKRLWITLVVSLVLSFSALLYLGGQIYQQAPPIPNAVKTTNGVIIYSKQDIEDGQNIWQTTGGMQQGSVWGAW